MFSVEIINLVTQQTYKIQPLSYDARLIAPDSSQLEIKANIRTYTRKQILQIHSAKIISFQFYLVLIIL